MLSYAYTAGLDRFLAYVFTVTAPTGVQCKFSLVPAKMTARFHDIMSELTAVLSVLVFSK